MSNPTNAYQLGQLAALNEKQAIDWKNPLVTGGIGAGLGALGGAGATALSDDEDKNYFTNTLLGATSGGLLGVGAGGLMKVLDKDYQSPYPEPLKPIKIDRESKTIDVPKSPAPAVKPREVPGVTDRQRKRFGGFTDEDILSLESNDPVTEVTPILRSAYRAYPQPVTDEFIMKSENSVRATARAAAEAKALQHQKKFENSADQLFQQAIKKQPRSAMDNIMLQREMNNRKEHQKHWPNQPYRESPEFRTHRERYMQ